MARMTDEELEQLLRETFADKEKLVDTLPEATKPHRPPVAPVLLAAAAVLVVLGGILYGVNRIRDVDPAPPVATAGQDAQIWGATITAITQRFQPQYKLDTLLVPGHTSTITTASRLQSGDERADAVRTFSAAEKDQIEDQVVTATHVQFRWTEPEPRDTIMKCFPTIARVSVGNVVDKGDHQEVPAWIAYNCGAEYWLTYRVEKRGDTWTTVGTVGPGHGMIPAGGCALSGKTPASPKPGC